jgi:hypothetical protein
MAYPARCGDETAVLVLLILWAFGTILLALGILSRQMVSS